VIGNGYQDRIQEAAFVLIGEPFAMEEKNGIGKGGSGHQLGDIVAAKPDRGIVRVDDRCAPWFLQVFIIPVFWKVR